MNVLEANSSARLNMAGKPAWFCVRSQPKREHFAAAYLSGLAGLQVFNPRLRRRLLTRRGPMWLTESLFPGYLFAHFDLELLLDRVRYTPAVSSIVRFGQGYPAVPEALIAELQRDFGREELLLVPDELAPGTRVTLTDRPFEGFQGTVLRHLPARQRVEVLLELLGRTTKVEVARHAVRPESRPVWGARPIAPAGPRILGPVLHDNVRRPTLRPDPAAAR